MSAFSRFAYQCLVVWWYCRSSFLGEPLTLMRISTFSNPVGRRFFLYAALVLTVTGLGTVGYMVVEGWGLVDSLYMTVITLSTVGFGEVAELSDGGRLFTVLLIISGVGTVTYVIGDVGGRIAAGDLGVQLRGRWRQRRIDMVKDHYIVCGYGRVGRQVALDLADRGVEVVVIEVDAERVKDAEDRFGVVVGDAPDDDILQKAGIDRAKGLVAVTGDDATNIFIVLSARTLNPRLTVVSRSNEPNTEPKLLKAGADHVISPYSISGRRIATQLLYPTVTDFFDVVMHSGDLELWLEEVTVHPGSDLDGKTVAVADVRQRTGVNVLAVQRKSGGKLITTPPGDLKFDAGDVVIGLGTGEQLRSLMKLGGDTVRELPRTGAKRVGA